MTATAMNGQPLISAKPYVGPDETQAAVLRELEPVAAQLLERHLSVAKDWMPHQYVPWSRGRDFDGPLGGEAWAPEQTSLPTAVRNALVLNLLTEDNLPSYHREITNSFGREGAWGVWAGRWTAEENRHGVAMRDYLTVTREADPIELEEARMAHMQTGHNSAYEGRFLDVLAYVSFQELATRVSHRNTGLKSGDEVCEQLMARIALDENLHMLFYRGAMAAAFDVDPDAAMKTVLKIITEFEMPGADMPNWNRWSLQIALAGIYDLRSHHDEVLAPVMRAWNLWDRTDVGPEGEAAREQIAAFMTALDAQATTFEEKRDARAAKLAARAG